MNTMRWAATLTLVWLIGCAKPVSVDGEGGSDAEGSGGHAGAAGTSTSGGAAGTTSAGTGGGSGTGGSSGAGMGGSAGSLAGNGGAGAGGIGAGGASGAGAGGAGAGGAGAGGAGAGGTAAGSGGTGGSSKCDAIPLWAPGDGAPLYPVGAQVKWYGDTAALKIYEALVALWYSGNQPNKPEAASEWKVVGDC